MKQEIVSLNEKLSLRDKTLFAMQADRKFFEDNFNSKLNEMEKMLNEKISENKELEEKFNKMEKELKVKEKN